MKLDGILINGVSLPYNVLDKAVERAKSHKSGVKAVFIYETDWIQEDHVIPDETELSKPDFSEINAEENMHKVMDTNLEYTKSLFAQNNILLETLVLKNPSVSDIAEAMEDVEFIYLDHATFTHPKEVAYVNLSIDELDEKLSSKLKWTDRE